MQSPIKFFSGSASSDLAIKIINGYNQAQKQMHLEGGHSIETLQNFELGKSSFTRLAMASLLQV